MEISKSQKALYSLWIAPIVPVAVWAILGLVTGVSLSNGRGTLVTNVAFAIVIPISYALGWFTSKAHEERLAFLISLTVYLVCLTMLILSLALTAREAPQANPINGVFGVFSCLAIIAGFVCALLRRKHVVERAAEYRSRGQFQDRMRGEQRIVDTGTSEQASSGSAQQRNQTQPAVSRPQAWQPIPPAQNPPRQTLASTIGATHHDAPRRGHQPVPTAAQPAPQAASPTYAVQPRTAVVGPASAPAAAPAPTTAPDSVSRTLDANSCSDTELLALPGMSAPVARAIVSEREQNGPYQSLEDLVTRNGLKPHVVAAFIGNLAVSAPSAAHAGSQHVRMLDL